MRKASWELNEFLKILRSSVKSQLSGCGDNRTGKVGRIEVSSQKGTADPVKDIGPYLEIKGSVTLHLLEAISGNF